MPGQALSVIMSIFVRWKQREIRLPERRRQRTVGTETGVTQPQAQERGTLDAAPNELSPEPPEGAVPINTVILIHETLPELPAPRAVRELHVCSFKPPRLW